MPQSDARYIASLAYWTVYRTINDQGPIHDSRGEDWATKTQSENVRHLTTHMASLIMEAHRNGDLASDKTQDIVHALVRAVMLYWSFLRDNNRLSHVQQLPKDFLEYLQKSKELK